MIPCSVVICTYNRLPCLIRCIESLLCIPYSPLDIIIINDGSTDGTKEYLENLHRTNIRVHHHEENRGLSNARNTGISLASHDIIAFTDDDCLPTSAWIEEMIKGFTDASVGFVIGETRYVRDGYKGYFPERLVQNVDAHWPMGCNIAYRKKMFTTIGGFDPAFFSYNNEDSEIAIRAVAKGYAYTRQTDAIVYHQQMNWTVPSLLRSAKNGAVWVKLKKMYPGHYAEFHPPVSFGRIIYWKDYLLLLFFPIFIPIQFVRYILRGKRDLKLFFTKWVLLLFLRRYYIYKEAIQEKIFMM